MAVNHKHAENDTERLTDKPLDADSDNTPKPSGRELDQQVLDIRRKIEDRLERRRLKEELGCDDLWELDM